MDEDNVPGASQKSFRQYILLSDSEENVSGNEAANLIPDEEVSENDGQAPCTSGQASCSRASRPRSHSLSMLRIRSSSPDFPVDHAVDLPSPSPSPSSSPLLSKRRSDSVPVKNAAASLTLRQMLMNKVSDFSDESSGETELSKSLPDSASEGNGAHETATPKGKKIKKSKQKGKSLLRRRKKSLKVNTKENLHSTHAYPHLPETIEAVDMDLLPGGLFQRMLPEPYVQETLHLNDVRTHESQKQSFADRMFFDEDSKRTCPPMPDVCDRGVLNSTSNFKPMVLPGFAKHRQLLHYKGRKYPVPNSYKVTNAADPHDRYQRSKVRETGPSGFCDRIPLPMRSSYLGPENSNRKRCCRAEPKKIKTREYLGEARTKTISVCPTNHGPKRHQYVSSLDLRQKTKEYNGLIFSFEVSFFRRENLLQPHVDIHHETMKQTRRKRPPASKADYLPDAEYLEMGALLAHSGLQRTHDFLRMRSEDGRRNAFHADSMDTDTGGEDDSDEDNPRRHRHVKSAFIKSKSGSRLGKVGMGPAIPNFSQAHRVC